MAIIINSQTKLTYEEYALLPEDGKIHEIIDGDHYMTPAPGTNHQTISRRIQHQLYVQIEERGLGVVFNAPTDLELSRIDIVQPDLLVILTARQGIVTPAKVLGAPDLVIEIVSKSTREKDETLKFALYQRSGVPEYWVVHGEDRVVKKYRLTESGYVLEGEFSDEIAVSVLPGVTVDLRRVW
jgi:Uma2 family endonuclease